VIVRLPGTYAPQHDTSLLISALRASGLARGGRVLDLCTGTGAVAIAAAGMGADCVTAVDLSRRAVMSARANSLLQRAGMDIRRGDLFAAIAGETFDVVLCNPPYVPAATDRLPRHSPGRSWDAGRDGRALVDRVCQGVTQVLRPGGTLLLTHTAVIDASQTLELLSGQGFETRIAASRRVPFGPVMNARTDLLAAQGIIRPWDREEELVVIEARMTCRSMQPDLSATQAPAVPVVTKVRLAG
jgi:release factor glutamine methyltransferase